MKTKSTILLILLTVATAFSQQLYFGVQSAGNLGVAKQNVSTYLWSYYSFSFTNVFEENGNTYEESVPVSMAEGFGYSAHIGYMQRKFGIELSAALIQSFTNTATYTTTSDKINLEIRSKNEMFKPAFVYKSDTTKFSIICKLGAVISTSQITNRMYTDGTNGSTKSEIQTLQTGNWKVGGFMSMGVEYKITKKLSLKALIDFTMVSFSPNQSLLTKYEINGEDQMILIPEEDRTSKFFDKYSDTDNIQNDQLAPKYNLTSIGFNMGIFYTISFKKH